MFLKSFYLLTNFNYEFFLVIHGSRRVLVEIAPKKRVCVVKMSENQIHTHSFVSYFVVVPHSNQITVVAFQPVQLAQA